METIPDIATLILQLRPIAIRDAVKSMYRSKELKNDGTEIYTFDDGSTLLAPDGTRPRWVRNHKENK